MVTKSPKHSSKLNIKTL